MPPNSLVEVLTLVPQSVGTVFGDRSFNKIIELKEVIRVGPNPIGLGFL